jgi:hypothetical protein
MPGNVVRLLQEITAAQDEDELNTIAAEIERTDFDEQALEQIANAIREARDRLSSAS